MYPYKRVMCSETDTIKSKLNKRNSQVWQSLTCRKGESKGVRLWKTRREWIDMMCTTTVDTAKLKTRHEKFSSFARMYLSNNVNRIWVHHCQITREWINMICTVKITNTIVSLSIIRSFKNNSPDQSDYTSSRSMFICEEYRTAMFILVSRLLHPKRE
jgi:hypothetical protein